MANSTILQGDFAESLLYDALTCQSLITACAEHSIVRWSTDELEALVPARGQLGGHQHYKAEEVNEFLARLINCAEKRILGIAATNQPQRIHPAVRRTGRLDKLIYVGPPDAEARREMLLLHLQGTPVSDGFNFEALAISLECYSASDIQFPVNEAARDALKKAQDIREDSIRAVMSRVQPTVLADIEAQYQLVGQRGF